MTSINDGAHPLATEELGGEDLTRKNLVEGAKQEFIEKIQGQIEQLEKASTVIQLYQAFHSGNKIAFLKGLPKFEDHPDMKVWLEAKKKLRNFSSTGRLEDSEISMV